MAKVALSDGGHFNPDTSVKFSESTFWDGWNLISHATGSQWEHEALYYTRKGKWVLNHWSQWQGSRESYQEIPLGEAVAWLVRNECEADAAYLELPEDVRAQVVAELEKQEV